MGLDQHAHLRHHKVDWDKQWTKLGTDKKSQPARLIVFTIFGIGN